MPDDDKPNGPTLIVNERWKVQQQIGHGGQARVYRAIDISDNSQVALKINLKAHRYRSLLNEKKAFDIITQKCGHDHQKFIPTLHYYQHDGKTEMIVFELMGPNLIQLTLKRGDLFSERTVIQIFKKTLKCLQSLHKIGLVHRDIKPDNICVGRQENMEDIRLIDLGHCKSYVDLETGIHKPLQHHRGLTGTLMFCSWHQQLGGSPTRLDDLEALCFSMMCIHSGTLPWTPRNGENRNRKDDFQAALEHKSKTAGHICDGFPKVFEDFLSYVRSLQFDSDPNYAHLHDILDKTPNIDWKNGGMIGNIS